MRFQVPVKIAITVLFGMLVISTRAECVEIVGKNVGEKDYLIVVAGITIPERASGQRGDQRFLPALEYVFRDQVVADLL